MKKFFFNKDGPVDLTQYKFIAYYFGASWDKTCLNFTKKHLSKFYSKINNDQSKQIEIVYVSLDKDEKSFMDYWGTFMPWAAHPYS